jgi:dienelactone hydrolase
MPPCITMPTGDPQATAETTLHGTCAEGWLARTSHIKSSELFILATRDWVTTAKDDLASRGDQQ